MLTGLLRCRVARFLPGLVIGFCLRWLTESGGAQVSTWPLKDSYVHLLCAHPRSQACCAMQPAQKRVTGKGKKAGQAAAQEDLKMVSAPLHGFLASAWRPSLSGGQCLTCRCSVSTGS